MAVCRCMHNMFGFFLMMTSSILRRRFCKNNINKHNRTQNKTLVTRKLIVCRIPHCILAEVAFSPSSSCTAPIHSAPHSYTANFSRSAMLHCSTAMCESTASLGSHSLSLLQFPKDYQQQCITSTLCKVPPLPSYTSPSTILLLAQTKPKKCIWGYFRQDCWR